jgi:exosome complex component RRP46
MAVAIAVVPTHGKGKQRAYDDVEEDEQMDQVVQGDEDVTLVLDPTRNEEQSSVARFCFGWAFGQEFSSVAPKDRGARGRSGEEEQDEEAECVYLESDGEFDAATVSLLPHRYPQVCRSDFCIFAQFQKAYSASRFACQTLMRTLRAQMTEHFEHSLAGNNA